MDVSLSDNRDMRQLPALSWEEELEEEDKGDGKQKHVGSRT